MDKDKILKIVDIKDILQKKKKEQKVEGRVFEENIKDSFKIDGDNK